MLYGRDIRRKGLRINLDHNSLKRLISFRPNLKIATRYKSIWFDILTTWSYEYVDTNQIRGNDKNSSVMTLLMMHHIDCVNSFTVAFWEDDRWRSIVLNQMIFSIQIMYSIRNSTTFEISFHPMFNELIHLKTYPCSRHAVDIQ